MGYGTPKIQNAEIKKAILSAVEDALNKQADVFQGSQAYYGYGFKVEVDLRLISRGVDNMKLVAAGTGGDRHPQEEKGGKLPPPEESSKITIAEASKGRQEIAKSGE